MQVSGLEVLKEFLVNKRYALVSSYRFFCTISDGLLVWHFGYSMLLWMPGAITRFRTVDIMTRQSHDFGRSVQLHDTITDGPTRLTMCPVWDGARSWNQRRFARHIPVDQATSVHIVSEALLLTLFITTVYKKLTSYYFMKYMYWWSDRTVSKIGELGWH